MGTLRNHVKSTIGNSGSANAAAKSVELFDEIVERLSAHFDKLSNGDDFDLLALMTEYHSQISAGNIQVANSTPAPAGALPAGKPTSSNTEAERVGTEALAIVGGDVTKVNGLLTMLEKIVASGPEATVLAGYVFNGLTGDEIKNAGPHLGDFFITVVKDLAAKKDEILPRGLGAELKSADNARRANNQLDADLKSLLNKLSVTKLADAQAAIDNLRNNTSAATLANQARTTDLNNIGTALGLNRNVGENDDAFQQRLVGEITSRLANSTTLHNQTQAFVRIAANNRVTLATGDLPLAIFGKIVAWQNSNPVGVRGNRPEIKI